MNKLLSFLLISIAIILPSIVSAATLQLSLTAQMIKQEQINKKYDLSNRLRIQAEKRQAAKDRILAMKYKQLVKKNNVVTTTIPTPTTQQPILTISRPPVLMPLTTIQPSTNPPVTNSVALSTNIPIPPNIDISRVRSTWIGWYNDIRKGKGLGEYSYDIRLDSTSYDWNREFAKGQGQNHHRRNPSDSYYSFSTIDTWFMNRGVDPLIINRSKHTENVGYGSYSCNSGDCTDAMIRSIRSTFDFYMSEKGRSYDPHYRSIINPYFSKIGLSIIVVPNENRYYLTVHYITE